MAPARKTESDEVFHFSLINPVVDQYQGDLKKMNGFKLSILRPTPEGELSLLDKFKKKFDLSCKTKSDIAEPVKKLQI